MTELPERAWISWPEGRATGTAYTRAAKFNFETRREGYLRADTAIPRAEADAMVVAAVDACAEVLEECGIDGSAFAQTFDEYRRGRAAFERAVREAVEAERERCAQLVEQECDCSTMARLVASIRAPQGPSE